MADLLAKSAETSSGLYKVWKTGRKEGGMRKVVTGAVVLMAAALVSGCATNCPMGAAYSKLKLPVGVTDNSTLTALKVGTAECKSYCGMVALGDASIDAAKKQGKITKVHHVDWEVESYAGVYAKYRVVVYGE